MTVSDMNEQAIEVLNYLYSTTSSRKQASLYSLEVEFGLDGNEIRSIIEDLREAEYAVETEEGVFISEKGVHYAKSRWP